MTLKKSLQRTCECYDKSLPGVPGTRKVVPTIGYFTPIYARRHIGL